MRTRFAPSLTSLLKSQDQPGQLVLNYDGRETKLGQDMPPIILGRSKKADMIINDSMASREPARIECCREKFELTGMSTNGTYALTPDGPSYLRREDIVLSREGKITLGRDLGEAMEVVNYLCD